MTKNILLTEIKRNDMGLSVKKLLDDYFSKDQVQDALGDIGESASGSKDELIRRLLNNWKSHNRDIYELLDFTDETSLQMICYFYALDATPAKNDVLIRRIKKANLLGSGSKPKPIAQVSKSHDSPIPKNKSKPDTRITDVHFHVGSVTPSRRWIIGIGIGVTSIIVTIIVAFAR